MAEILPNAFPGLALSLAVVGINLSAEGLTIAWNLQLRQRHSPGSFPFEEG
jgi:ABC-type dipeptide/oligopeptide/nickel transport system permease subunit